MEDIVLNPVDLWKGALLWTFIGIAFIKLLVLDKKVILNKEFDFWYWIKDNVIDVLRGLVLTLITLKLGDVVLQLLQIIGIDFNGVAETIRDAGLDPIQISLLVSVAFQWWLYKRRQKKLKNNSSSE